MTTTEQSPNNVGPRTPGRPKTLTVDEAQAAYEAACDRVAKAEKDERKKAATLADTTEAYKAAVAAHADAEAYLERAETAKAAARAALRKAQGRTT